MKIALVGLGYVGLPIALEFAGIFDVIGFDIDQRKIDIASMGRDPNDELDPGAFVDKNITFTSDERLLKSCTIYVIAVPTPVTRFKVPDLRPLQSASKTVAKYLKKGDLVIYESTVYPGCTEEDCVPILEDLSGLKLNEDFKVGYSPERINPGDKVHTLTNTVKVVSGSDEAALEQVANLYESIITAGVHRAPSIKVAEASKIIENTQRDVNIALMNELSIIFDRAGINTADVLAAAGTKWNFLKFYPGLVGGHCIGVDPYYLTHKAIELGYSPEMILTGRKINDNLSKHVAKKAVNLISEQSVPVHDARVLVLGITFKENVSDIRNSKVVDVVKELQSFGISVDIMDPHAASSDLEASYGLSLVSEPRAPYDCIILAVKHDEYLSFDEDYFKSLSRGKGALIDIKSQFTTQIHDMLYWSL